MQVFQNLPPIVGLILGLVLLAWLIFVFLVPFMIEGIRQSARKTHAELVELNEKMDRLTAALEASSRASAAGTEPVGAGASAAQTRRPAAQTRPGGAARDSRQAARGAKPERGPRGERAERGEPRGRREPTISDTDFEEVRTPGRRGPDTE